MHKGPRPSVKQNNWAALMFSRAGALVQWLKLPAWTVGDSGLVSHSGLQVSKKQNVTSNPVFKIWMFKTHLFPNNCHTVSFYLFNCNVYCFDFEMFFFAKLFVHVNK